MENKNFSPFRKQVLRGTLSKWASYTEIYVSFLVLVGIVLLSIVIAKDIISIGLGLVNGEETLSINVFLATAFELIIGIEFVKMLAKHTPSSAVEVLLYAIARQLISAHDGHMADALIGVVAIALLFGIRKFLSEPITKSNDHEFIVNGSISVKELNEKFGSNIDTSLGNTIAGVLYNSAKNQSSKLKPGFSIEQDNFNYEVYSMDAGLIKQVKVESNHI